MAAGSLLTLLDDIATILDDVSVMTKTAAAKTAGVLGDDLALNAQQVSGVVAKRELPVVWAVAKGSFVNKLILVPAALAISAFAPWAVTPLLMVGGLYLCFEGCEKLAHHFFHRKEKSKKSEKDALAGIKALEEGGGDEKSRIKGAIRTDFVLSAEIIAITLGTVAGEGLLTQSLVLSIIAVVMTVGVYGLVACIVKLDDLGLLLSQRAHVVSQKLGLAILWAAPFLMKTLSIVGTAAMFLVGGGILTHGLPWVHHGVEHMAESVAHAIGIGGFVATVSGALLNGLFGLAAGTVALLIWKLIRSKAD